MPSGSGTTELSEDLATITLQQAKEVILACPLEIPIMMWGDTGIGKTQIVEHIGRLTNLPVKTVIAQTTTPMDWMGIPHLETIDGVRYTRFSQPLMLPQAVVHGERGIFFYDEFPNSTKAVQAAIQSLLTQNSYNGYEMPRGWKQIAAGNRMRDRANTFEMPRPVANRMMHLNIGYDDQSWQKWAAGSVSTDEKEMGRRSLQSIADLYPDGSSSRVHPLVRAFLTVRPSMLKGEESGNAFATPRTWHYTSHVLQIENLPDELLMIMLQGLLGAGAAGEFMTYLKDTSILPDPRDLLNGDAALLKEDKDGVPVTYLKVAGEDKRELEASQLYAVACSISTAVGYGKEELNKFFELLGKFPSPEYGIVAFKEVCERMPEAAITELSAWAMEVADALGIGVEMD